LIDVLEKPMMRGVHVALLALGLSLADVAYAGPVGGGFSQMIQVPAGDAAQPGESELKTSVTFAAGQRACVIVVGRSEPATNDLRLVVLDEAGAVVAADSGAYELAAIWYPRRDMTCRIRVLNGDGHEQQVMVTVR
jgi:hypothetical protein